jgi:DNA replication and repair protein RecF
VRVYELTLTPAGRRVTLDGKAVRPLSKYFGGFNVVVFTPEDLQLPRGAPGDRRRFLDRAVFNARPDYLGSATDYEKVLKQRNAILRDAAGACRGDALHLRRATHAARACGRERTRSICRRDS